VRRDVLNAHTLGLPEDGVSPGARGLQMQTEMLAGGSARGSARNSRIPGRDRIRAQDEHDLRCSGRGDSPKADLSVASHPKGAWSGSQISIAVCQESDFLIAQSGDWSTRQSGSRSCPPANEAIGERIGFARLGIPQSAKPLVQPFPKLIWRAATAR
jgi:hypothetical protein